MKSFLVIRSFTKHPPVLLLGMLLLLSSSCISSEKKTLFQLWKNKSKLVDYSAKQIDFQAPPQSYKQKKHPELEGLWKNKKAGTSISYLSNCSSTFLSLEEITRDALAQFDQYKVIGGSKGKQSLYTTISVSHPNRKKTWISFYTFRQKKCFYILNLIADTVTSFKTEQIHFDNFVKSFKAGKN